MQCMSGLHVHHGTNGCGRLETPALGDENPQRGQVLLYRSCAVHAIVSTDTMRSLLNAVWDQAIGRAPAACRTRRREVANGTRKFELMAKMSSKSHPNVRCSDQSARDRYSAMATSIARQHHHLSAMTESEPQATPRTQYRDRRTETHHQQAQHFRCGRAGRKQTFGPNALHPPTPATAARDRWPFARALLAEYTHTLNEQCAGCPATAAPSRRRLQATALVRSSL
jgi:hypothetical protein